jgi:hypothetical protein
VAAVEVVVGAEAVALRLQPVVEVAAVAVQLQQLEDSAVRRLPQQRLRFRPYPQLRMQKHPMRMPQPLQPQPAVAVVDNVVVAEEALPRQPQAEPLPQQVVEVELPQQLQVPRSRSHFIAHVNKPLIPFLRPTRSRKGTSLIFP